MYFFSDASVSRSKSSPSPPSPPSGDKTAEELKDSNGLKLAKEDNVGMLTNLFSRATIGLGSWAGTQGTKNKRLTAAKKCLLASVEITEEEWCILE